MCDEFQNEQSHKANHGKSPIYTLCIRCPAKSGLFFWCRSEANRRLIGRLGLGVWLGLRVGCIFRCHNCSTIDKRRKSQETLDNELGLKSKAPKTLKIVHENLSAASIDFLGIICPRPLPPIAKTARLQQQIMEQGIAVAMLAGEMGLLR